jgi:predicted permease
MSAFFFDLRHALRALTKAPTYSLVIIVTLALGIGANSAIFSIVNSVVLRPLDYPRPGQLMYLTTRFPLRFEQFWVSPPEYMEFREINQSFSAVGAFTTGEANLTAGDRPLRVRSASVDEHLLTALGIQAAQGRLFAPGETDAKGAVAPGLPPVTDPVAILSHELWSGALGRQAAIGTLIEVNGRRLEIIGVMPPGADVMDNRTEIWLPLGLNPANRQNRGNHYLYLIGRTKDGISAEAANTELEALIANWGARVGVKDHVYTPGGHALQMEPLQDEMVGAASRGIWALQAGVGLVLLIACANLAGLLLARAERRHRELAMRAALGATGRRLLQQTMAEGFLLSLGGGALGLLLAYVGVGVFVRAYPDSLPRTSEVDVDGVVLLFTLGVSMATGLIFGLTPMLYTRMKRLTTALAQGETRSATATVRHRLQRGLVMGEIAMAVMVAAGAGLLTRTVENLTNVDAGFNRSRLVTFFIALPAVNYTEPAVRAQLYQRLLADLRGVPGVQAATAMSGLPPSRPLNANDTDIDNYTAPPEGPFENVDYYQGVMSDYLETMGIPIVQGRGFAGVDAAASGMVTVVNETLAGTFWRGQNPIGQRLRPCCSDKVPWFTVIGVAKDVKQGGIDQRTGTEFYRLIDQTAFAPAPATYAPASINVVLRTILPAAAMAATVERLVRELDPTVPVARLREMEEVFGEQIRRPRLMAQLVSGFAGLALLLAAIGTYGVLSSMVLERRREIGIRIALGADRRRVLSMVMKQGLIITAVGLGGGLLGALGLNRLMGSLLFGVRPTDPATLGSVVLAIALVAAVACWLPAWRASHLDPNSVLKDA